MNNWLLLKSVFTLHAGYSLRALKNKLKLLVLIGQNWSGLNVFLARMSNALGKSGIEKLGAIVSVWFIGPTSVKTGALRTDWVCWLRITK